MQKSDNRLYLGKHTRDVFYHSVMLSYDDYSRNRWMNVDEFQKHCGFKNQLMLEKITRVPWFQGNFTEQEYRDRRLLVQNRIEKIMEYEGDALKLIIKDAKHRLGSIVISLGIFRRNEKSCINETAKDISFGSLRPSNEMYSRNRIDNFKRSVIKQQDLKCLVAMLHCGEWFVISLPLGMMVKSLDNQKQCRLVFTPRNRITFLYPRIPEFSDELTGLLNWTDSEIKKMNSLPQDDIENYEPSFYVPNSKCEPLVLPRNIPAYMKVPFRALKFQTLVKPGSIEDSYPDEPSDSTSSSTSSTTKPKSERKPEAVRNHDDSMPKRKSESIQNHDKSTPKPSEERTVVPQLSERNIMEQSEPEPPEFDEPEPEQPEPEQPEPEPEQPVIPTVEKIMDVTNSPELPTPPVNHDQQRIRKRKRTSSIENKKKEKDQLMVPEPPKIIRKPKKPVLLPPPNPTDVHPPEPFQDNASIQTAPPSPPQYQNVNPLSLGTLPIGSTIPDVLTPKHYQKADKKKRVLKRPSEDDEETTISMPMIKRQRIIEEPDIAPRSPIASQDTVIDWLDFHPADKFFKCFYEGCQMYTRRKASTLVKYFQNGNHQRILNVKENDCVCLQHFKKVLNEVDPVRKYLLPISEIKKLRNEKKLNLKPLEGDLYTEELRPSPGFHRQYFELFEHTYPEQRYLINRSVVLDNNILHIVYDHNVEEITKSVMYCQICKQSNTPKLICTKCQKRSKCKTCFEKFWYGQIESGAGFVCLMCKRGIREPSQRTGRKPRKQKK